ncbi:MAG: hypothetical protein CUN52_05850 [Phototrophicales bacterium]|jgi:sortase A|nr:MAG: hypothetical protein CUN52_05850 [Phototrophicales bacterium]
MAYRDKRPVDELSIEELERILTIRKRELREKQMARMKKTGRVLPTDVPKPSITDLPANAPISEIINQQLEALSGGNGTPTSPTVSSQPPVIKTASPRFDDDERLIQDLAELRQRQQEARDRVWRRFVNTSLLLVEVAAVFGLFVLVFMLFQSVQELESQTAAVQQEANATRSAMIPTLEPTPVLRLKLADVVLPGGHIITESGGVRFKQEEIPSHLLPLVKEEIETPPITRPPKTPETALRISIPRLNLDESIVQGSDWEALKQGVGQVLNGARPGDDTGNVVLAAHNDVYGELFRHLDQMQVGDQFTIQTEQNVYVYKVREILQVEPTDVWVMQNTGVPTATLISCYPYRVNTHRIIVFADRIN